MLPYHFRLTDALFLTLLLPAAADSTTCCQQLRAQEIKLEPEFSTKL
jgi:hypothetical protein